MTGKEEALAAIDTMWRGIRDGLTTWGYSPAAISEYKLRVSEEFKESLFGGASSRLIDGHEVEIVIDPLARDEVHLRSVELRF